MRSTGGPKGGGPKGGGSKKRGSGGGAGGRGGAGGAQRNVAVRVKTAKKRSNSSTRWLQRQLNDPYVAEARRLGFRSRAAFKIAELDDRFRFLRRGATVVDLGAAPGGWSQVAVDRVGAISGAGGKVIGLDYLEMDPVPGASILLADFMTIEGLAALEAAVDGPVDVVLSDMAAPTTGHSSTDHIRTAALCEAAYEFAVQVLGPGGAFVAKVFKGGSERALLDRMKRSFETVRHAKPPSSRAESAETYVVALGFRGGESEPEWSDSAESAE
jgi:23S rRNA (uridine2552-2'-O)-methyltransferase